MKSASFASQIVHTYIELFLSYKRLFTSTPRRRKIGWSSSACDGGRPYRATTPCDTSLESPYNAQHFIFWQCASILNRIEVKKLQSYDNRKIAKTLPNEQRDLWTVGVNLHESLIQCNCTWNIVHWKPAFSFPKSCLEFECELFCRPGCHFSAQFGAHFGG